MVSVSMTKAPSSAKIVATALFPAPMPPVRPTRTARRSARLAVRLRGGHGRRLAAALFLDRVQFDLFGRHVGDVLDRGGNATRRVVDRQQRHLDLLTRH